jgi:Peptidase M16 inactive domain
MLPRALEALCDVLEAKVEKSRLEKERAAVLSEMTMVNTIDYRVECQILAALHSENMLSRRFPIGKEALIKAWTVDDVKAFHAAHYSPDNAIVYVVGDVSADACEEQLRKVFGHLPRGGTGSNKASSGELSGSVSETSAGNGQKMSSLKQQSSHFPPVSHVWAGGHVTAANTLDVMPTYDGKPLHAPRIFSHDLLQAFSLHVFAKRPIESISQIKDFRRAIMKRIALAALQVSSSTTTTYSVIHTILWYMLVCSNL